jgi:ribosome biogenesis GTPase
LLEVSQSALTPLGWDERVATWFVGLALPETVPGRVIRVDGGSSVVATPAGELQALASTPPAVGDWVAVDRLTDEVAAAMPRWTELARQDPAGGKPQILAVNVDLVIILAPADRVSPARVERELVLAWGSGAEAVVVLTKADLAAPGAARRLARRLVGADVRATSAKTGEGVEPIAHLLRPNKTAVLLGPSGAGKSTLANALLGEDRLSTGAVREGDRRGRHTTTSRVLLAVPGGGVLIDTPGLRGISLLHESQGIQATFGDIEELATGCRFSDCHHEVEPSCAVREAVGAGRLDARRLASYRKLQREFAVVDQRGDPRARQASERQWKAITRAGRQAGLAKRRHR